MFGLRRVDEIPVDAVSFFRDRFKLKAVEPEINFSLLQNNVFYSGVSPFSLTETINEMRSYSDKNSNIGGIIFNTSSEYVDFYNTERIGLNGLPINIFAGLEPEVIANTLKNSFELNGNGIRNESPFWLNSATELFRNTLGILQCTPDAYTLRGLCEFVFKDDSRGYYREKANEAVLSLGSKPTNLLAYGEEYFDFRYTKFQEEKTLLDVLASCNELLSPFTNEELLNAFSASDAVNLGEMSKGKTYVVNVPADRWGHSATVIRNLLQLHFKATAWDSTEPAFFLTVK